MNVDERHIAKHLSVWRRGKQIEPYAYVIERADDGAYWAYLPDLPGCTTTGETPEAVERRLREAVVLYLSYYADRVPPPRPQARVGTLTAA